jgi:hypothetical protein
MGIYHCPKCKKIMKRGVNSDTWSGKNNYYHTCTNPTCWMFGIPRIMPSDVRDSGEIYITSYKNFEIGNIVKITEGKYNGEIIRIESFILGGIVGVRGNLTSDRIRIKHNHYKKVHKEI